MHDFLLRVFFSGLIAFVVSADRTEMTVLMLETHNHTISDGTALAHHTPLVAIRGESCSGDCTPRNLSVAAVLFPDKTEEQAADMLEAAVSGGSAWLLANSEISVRPAAGTSLQPALTIEGGRPSVNGVPAAIPATAEQRADFSWVPDIKTVLPSFGQFNPQLFGERPPQNLVAARLRLRNGTFKTAKLARIDGKVKPVGFRAMGSAQPTDVFQAAATFAMAEITVPGSEITFTARNFDDGSERTMTLTPHNGIIDAAFLNLPALDVPDDPDAPVTPSPAVHWEAYFSLAATPAPVDQRPVPYARPTTLEQDYDILHPRAELWSPLLDKLRFGIARSAYDPILCPVGQGQQP